MNHIIYFDNINELDKIILNSDFNLISKNMEIQNIKRKFDVYKKWTYIFDKYIFNI